ncbi:uncharacterized protein H6S33_011435 [Morchella sextelata]|uniref:uncharacterized protein n=1 Tax=Morchella sextelata TaxID=1174677 RepID=UPI001D038096|nr:uncharacterized protein H6S33_011435 [Morchella sextelata]KAH0611008.1 hypothetical protein H6S33_011435 [Morchella sextelata]
MSDPDTSSPTTTAAVGGDIFGDYIIDQQHTGSEVNTDTDTSRETDSDYTDPPPPPPPPPPPLPPIVTNEVYSRIPIPVTGSRRSYIAPPSETNDHYHDDNNEEEDDEAAAIRAEEVRERFRKGVRRVICVLRMMKEMPGETWRKGLGETW